MDKLLLSLTKKILFVFALLICIAANQNVSAQTISIGTGATGSVNTYGPVSTVASQPRTLRIAYIYPGSLLTGLNNGDVINSFEFNRITATQTLPVGASWKIYVKNTTAADWGAGSLTWTTAITGTTTVFNGDPSSFVGNAAGFRKVDFTTPYVYNTANGSNLAILIEYIHTTQPTAAITWGYDGSASVSAFTTNQVKYTTTATTTPSATMGTSTANHPQIKINYTYNLNASISKLISPLGACAGSTDSVRVQLKNNGYDTITSAIINWTYNGVAQTPFNFTGSILKNATATVAIGQQTYSAGQPINIKVWVSAPNGGTDQFAGDDTLQKTASGPALSGNFLIGGATPDYPDLVSAVNDLNQRGICGPVTFDVDALSGPYTGQLKLNHIYGTSATNTITFNGNGATIIDTISSTESANRYIVYFDGADRTTFNNFTITYHSSSIYGNPVIIGNDAHYNTIKNCNILLDVNATATNFMGLVFTADPAATVPVSSSYNVIENNTIEGGYLGIGIYGAGAACRGTIIKNNIIKDSYVYGIYVSAADSTQVITNEVLRPARITYTTGYGIYLTGHSQQALIDKNKIHDVYQGVPVSASNYNAIYVTGNDAKAGKEVIIRNNLVYNFKNNGQHVGLYNNGSDSVWYYHNTVVFDHVGATGGNAMGMYHTTLANGVRYMNNNIYISKGGNGNKYAVYVNTTGITNVSNYNNLFVDTTVGKTGLRNVGYYATANFVTLADWKTANSGAYDQNSVSASPIFANINTGDFTPNTFTLNNIGTPLAAVTEDFTGAPRNPTTPDPGAYEFTPIADDAAISALSLVNGTCAGNNNILATLKNSGANNLTSVQVNWTVNGVPMTPLSYTGTLTPGKDTVLNLGNYNVVLNNTYDVIIWSASPNGNTDSRTSNDTLKKLNYKSAMAGNYTVGGVGADYTTISAAATDLNNRGVCAPVVINVNPSAGPYNEQVRINTVVGASAANTITLNGHNSVLNFTSNSSVVRYGIYLAGSDYVTIDSFIINSATGLTNYGWGVQLASGSDYNTIKNNTINVSDTVVTANLYAGIVFSNSITTIASSGLYVGNVVENNKINGGYYGISLYGTSGSNALTKGNKIVNNKITNAYTYGIYVYYQDSTQIIGNDISRPTRSVFSTFAGIYGNTLGNSTRIEKNKIHNPFGGSPVNTSTAYGIYLATSHHTPGKEGIVANNLIYDFNGNGTHYGFYNTASGYIGYYHNTVVFNNKASTAGTTYGFYQTTVDSFIVIKNNLFSISRGGTGTKYVLYFGTGTSKITSNNNDLYMNAPAGTNYIGYWSSARATLAAWQSANTTAPYDMNSFVTDPWFIHAAGFNFKPNSGVINNAGAVTSVTTDITGAARGGNPDIGAYEFTPNQNDAGLIAYITPVRTCAGSNDVKVKIKNYGTNPLNVLTVTWSLNNVTQSTYIFGGSLLTGKDTTVTVGAFLSAANTTYQIKVWSTLPNGTADENTFDDSLTRSDIQAGLAGIYNIGGPSADYANIISAVNDLALRGICSDVEFNIDPNDGPYIGQIQIPEIPGASAINTITFNGNGSVVKALVTTSAQRGIIWLNGADYITLDSLKLELDQTSTYGFPIVLSDSANHNIIRNNHITSMMNTSSTNFAGIVIGGAASISTASRSTFNVIENNFVQGGYYSIVVYGTSGSNGSSKGNIIRNNKVYDFYSYGIYHYYSDSTHIIGNDIARPTASTISTAYGIYINGLSQLVTIESNRIHDLFNMDPGSTSTVYGIYLSTGAVQSGKFTTVKNNLLYNINNSGTHYCMYNTTSGNALYYHNTISDDYLAATAGSVYGFYQTGATTGIELKNNIFNMTKGGTTTKYGIYMGTATTTITSNYNDFYVPGGNVGYNGSAKQTLPLWQAVANNDLNSDTLNPNFAYAAQGDYSPASLLLDNRGTNIGVTNDINGNARSSSSPDMGAYEFTPISDDAGVTVLGLGSICPGSNDIKVRIKNFGVLTLTTVNVNWSINGVNQTVFNYSGNLAQGQDTLITLGSIVFVAATNYDFKFWTSSPNGVTDGNHANDTLRRNGVKTGLSGTYTIGGAGANYPNISAAVNALSDGVCGPVVFNVNPSGGPYIEQVTINTIGGASATNTITFNGHGATIRYSPTVSAARHIFKLKGADYVTIDSFYIEVDAAATYGFPVHVLTGSDHNTIKNCTIVSSTTSTSTNFGAVNFSGSETSATTASGGSNYNVVENNVIIGGYYTLSLYGSTSLPGNMKGNIFRNNRIEDSYGYNIYTVGCDSTTISGNELSRPSRTSVTTFYGIYNSTNSHRLLVEKNKIHNPFDGITTSTSAFYGIYTVQSKGRMGQENIIKNNLIYNVNGLGAHYGITNYGSDSTFYFNNTVVLNDTASSANPAYGFYQVTTACMGVQLKNNLYFINRKGSANRMAMFWSTGTSTFESNHNNFYVTNIGASVNAIASYNGVYNTLMDWQLSNSSAYDQNSYSLHPLFNQAASGNYRPFSGGLDNRGTPLLQVTHDILDSLRNTTTPDIGAYEFTAFGEDAGVASLGFPSVCPGLNNVSVIISNSSANVLGSVDIGWSVNGVAQTPFSYAGAIPTGQTANVVIGTYTFAQGVSYNLKFWTYNPNLQADANPINDTLVVNGFRTALSGTYTVGGAGTDFADLATLASYLNSAGVCGPATFNITSTSVFNEQIKLNDIPGSSSVNTITINGKGATLKFAPTLTEERHVLQLNGTKYLTLDSLKIEVDAAATYGFALVMSNNANYNTIRNCTVKSLQTTSSNYAAFVIGSSSSISVASNSKYNLIENNLISGGYYCLSIYGTSGSNALTKGNIIRNNKIQDFYSYGLYHYYADSTHIIGNDISRPNATSPSTAYCIYVLGASQDLTIEKNRIHNLFDQLTTSTSSIYGIYLSTGASQAGRTSIVKNNLIYNMNNNGAHYGIYNATSGNVMYYHNTVVSDFTAATAGAVYGFYQSGSATGIELRNNLFAITKGGSGAKYGIYMATATTPLISNYNNIFVPGGNVGYNSVAKATLADWQAVANNDTNSVTVDPVFSYAVLNNYSPTSAAMDNLGAPLSVVPEDITGALRNVTTPDMGAYEFTPVANDLTAGKILYPGTNVCGLPADSVVIVIKNLGASSQSNFTIKVDVSGAATASLTKLYSGTLVSGASDTVTIGPYNSNANGTASIKVYTQLAADQFLLNDTLSQSMILSQASAMPGGNDVSVCKGSQATLVAITPLSIVRWYDAPAGGNLLTVNDTLVTPVINGTTKYYVEAATGSTATYHVGALNTSIGSVANFTDPTVQYMEFTAHATFTLDSVWVYPNAAGTVGIRILSTSGAVLQTATATVSAAQTLQRIYVGLVIPPGSYRMDGGGSTTGGLWRNSTGASYPYTVPGIVTITGNSFGTGYYYYFYNWRITGGSVSCPSPRKEITVHTLPSLPGSTYAKSTPFDGVYNAGSFANPDAACVGHTMTYDIAAPTGFNVSDFGTTWDISDATVKTSSGQTAPGTFTVSGRQIKYVTAPISNDSILVLTVKVKDLSGTICDTVMKRHIQIYPEPVVDLGPDTVLCSGQVLTLTAPSSTTYLWSTGATTQSINVLSSGNYTVTIGNVAGCTSFDVINATFNPSPSANLPNDTTGCGSVVLNAGNAAPGITYLWNTGATTQTITVTNSGSYSVRVTGVGVDACFRDDTVNVTINTAPVVDLGAASMNICTSDTITLDAGNPGSTYLWSTGATTQTIKISLAGTYVVTVTNTNGCKAKDSVIVSNKPAPDASFTFITNNLQANFTVPNQSGVAYSWNFGDNTNSTQSNPAHAYSIPGTYTVTLTVTNVSTGCKSIITQQVTVVNVGVGITKNNYELKAYPNPFADKTTISFELIKESEVTLEVYDVIGKKVAVLIDSELLNGKQNREWNVESNDPEMYFIKLTINGQTTILKAVSQ